MSVVSMSKIKYFLDDFETAINELLEIGRAHV